MLQVTITVYKPGSDVTVAEQRTIEDDMSVVITKGASGEPKIVRVKYGTLWQPDPYDEGKD